MQLEVVYRLLLKTRQYVKYGSPLSSLALVTSDIIQSSSAGLSLLKIYINDLHQVGKHCKSGLFTNDLKAVGAAASAKSAALVQCDLATPLKAARSIENVLPISLPKCSVLHYGCQKSQEILHAQRSTCCQCS